jgi:four helix bundle protein
MNYQEWQLSLPSEITEDPLWHMELYRQALFLSELTWKDAQKLEMAKIASSLSSQLLRAVGSIAANIAEGFSHASKKNQARFYEYALGSARESKVWYIQARHVLGEAVYMHRISLLTHITKQLLSLIPNRRGYKIKDANASYEADSLFSKVPVS